MKKDDIFTIGIILILISVIFIPISQSIETLESNKVISSGKTLYVGGSGPGNFSKIKYAIENASDGDIVFVYSGIYYENLRINKSIALIGEDKQSTVIDGGGMHDVVLIYTDNVSIENFYINNSGHYDTDAGILVYGDIKNITIINNIIIDNYFGICVGSPYFYKRITDVRVLNNYIQNKKHGLALYEGDYSTVLDNAFVDNGIIMPRGSSRDNTILRNTINGLPLIYLEKQSDKTVQPNAGQIILVLCNNITVSYQNLDIKSGVGIELVACHNCNIIKNCISNKSYAIFCIYSDDNNIQGNIIESSTTGINVKDSDKISISFNCIYNSKVGINQYRSNHNMISYNVFNNISTGIDFWESNYNEISKNKINKTKWCGIDFFFSCNRNKILNNTIQNCRDEAIIILGTRRIWWGEASIKNVISGNKLFNNKCGVLLDEAALTTVSYNDITENYCGVEVASARYNKIFNNNIYNNIEEDAILKNSFSSRVYRNFWNETKKIHVIKGGIYRWDFWGETYVEILPLLRFDWHAVMEPYNIG